MSLDPKKVIGVVMSYAKARDVTVSHLPYWLKVCDRLIIMVPEGQRLELGNSRVTEIDMGQDTKFHAGEDIHRRIYHGLREALKTDYQYIMAIEHDSLCWSPILDRAIPKEGELGACMFHNEDYDPVPGIRFISPIYIHFPHLYTRTALEKMLALLDSGEVSFTAEHSYIDRWLGLLAHKAGVPVLNYRSKIGRAHV